MTAMLRRTDTPSLGRAPLRLAALAASLLAILAASLPAPAAAAQKRRPSALPAFNSCTSLLSYARRNLRRTGGAPGVVTRAGFAQPQVLNSPGPVALDSASPTVSSAPLAPAAPPAAAGGEAKSAPSFSSTNVQEAGVDEPDIIKTDGRRVFAVADGRLNAFEATAGSPKLVGSLELAGTGGHQLLLRGDRLLVMTTTYGPSEAVVAPGRAVPPQNVPYRSTVLLSELDVSNPAAMTVRRTMQLDGALSDARLHGGTARVVVVSSPGTVEPQEISQTGVRRYVPRTILRSKISGRTFRRSVASCSDVRHPRAFSGLDLLTVLTIDIDRGLFDVDRDAIMAGAQTVYGSPTALYVASQRYVRALESGHALPESMRTEIHRFDASKEGETSYSGSGQVTGYVLNQYSLSEHDGALRVASTEEPQWFEGNLSRDSESYVTVLNARSTTLAPLGRVGGLGKGERIYAVRFVGDKGYVVTFRQVDPLYTLDLSDERDPKVLGELKILGYSAYLHPVSDDLLLGVGIDATEAGRRLGSQVSLFDVSNLRNPVRKAQAELGANSTTSAEFDPHAFLYWNPTRLTVIPLRVYGVGDPALGFNGAIGLRVGTSSLGEVGRVTHPKKPGQGGFTPDIARSLVIGDRLYTLSYAGLGTSSLDTLAPLSFSAFPDVPSGPPPPPVVMAAPMP